MVRSANTSMGSYRLLRLIGSGGMGEVYQAQHQASGQLVALKILASAIAEDPQAVGRLFQEARVLAQLNHPNVVRILHCDRADDGTAYLAMEYLSGLSLRAWLKQFGESVELAVVLMFGAQIADGMTAVHKQGIVHREV